MLCCSIKKNDIPLFLNIILLLQLMCVEHFGEHQMIVCGIFIYHASMLKFSQKYHVLSFLNRILLIQLMCVKHFGDVDQTPLVSCHRLEPFLAGLDLGGGCLSLGGEVDEGK